MGIMDTMTDGETCFCGCGMHIKYGAVMALAISEVCLDICFLVTVAGSNTGDGAWIVADILALACVTGALILVCLIAFECMRENTLLLIVSAGLVAGAIVIQFIKFCLLAHGARVCNGRSATVTKFGGGLANETVSHVCGMLTAMVFLYLALVGVLIWACWSTVHYWLTSRDGKHA